LFELCAPEEVGAGEEHGHEHEGDEDLKRERNKEDLDLRHEAGEDTHSSIYKNRDNQEWCGDFYAYSKGCRN